MKGLILVLYSIKILGALLCGAKSTTAPDSATVSTSEVTYTTASVMSSTGNLIPTGLTTKVSQFSTRSTTTSSLLHTTPGLLHTTKSANKVFRKECHPILIVSGGLIVFCAILLVSTLLLAWKVCQLSRRIKALSSNADLICYSEPLIETAKTDKSKSETDAKETNMLMTDVVQTQEEVGNGTTKEEGGMVNKDEQMGEEKKEEEGANNEEASTTPETVPENSSSSKPQEEAQATKAVAAPSSQGTEEPKDVV
ncbi:uncharacterized protein LOC123963537 [Micropterus dolomieu]|uniref:uncharacterized protein LOC123963537 n=1 Tax=Micropterus dolomieu TaxID=147949 RepID=UPI001E8EC047|nr:uncharacterized protein LOC123963537 [Micropterus dolomieu]